MIKTLKSELILIEGEKIFGGEDLSINTPLKLQINSLKEDICQISMIKNGINLVVDFGWYPEDFEISKSSYFLLLVVQDFDWERPLFSKKIYEIEDVLHDFNLVLHRLRDGTISTPR